MPRPFRPVRAVWLASALALSACGSDEPADVTVDGVDPVQTDTDLVPDTDPAPDDGALDDAPLDAGVTEPSLDGPGEMAPNSTLQPGSSLRPESNILD